MVVFTDVPRPSATVSNVPIGFDNMVITATSTRVQRQPQNAPLGFADMEITATSRRLDTPQQRQPQNAPVGFDDMVITATTTRLGVGKPIQTNYRFSSLSSNDFAGFAAVNEFASSIRQQLSAVQFGMSGLLNRVMGAAPIQQFLSGLRTLNSIASGLNRLRSMRNNLKNTINSNLIGVRSQLRSIADIRNRFP